MNTPKGPLASIFRFCLEQKALVVILAAMLIVAGLYTAPFNWSLGGMPRNPVPVDAIPDIGENQQIVFTEWPGRSPQDVENQITYPLTTALLGVPGVKTVRSTSMFGFSSIYLVFNEDVEFYWSRSRILEKLSSLPAATLPEGVAPALGPDATALGQVFWYTLEGRDAQGNPAGGWGLDDLRSIQDWTVRYALLSAEGVAEVASVGGFVREYQVDLDPDAMRAFDVSVEDVFNAVRKSNIDVGARTIEVNRVEHVVRGLGYLRSVEDLENTVIRQTENAPLLISHVARVTLGPAQRFGALDKSGAEAVGGVVVVRHAANPLEVINNVKDRIAEISPGLPSKTLPDGRVSRVSIVPFYDRTQLIEETLDTLSTAIIEQILLTIVVVIVMVNHLRTAALISAVLPAAVLSCFILMRFAGVDANVVSLAGIAIAIGTLVDMGIILCENILKHLDEAPPDEPRINVVHRATTEVGSAIITAVGTTLIGFLPVFAMTGSEGKLFRPLAFTKTFALAASVVVALTIIPPAAHILLGPRAPRKGVRRGFYSGVVAAGLVIALSLSWWAGGLLALVGAARLAQDSLPKPLAKLASISVSIAVAVAVCVWLSERWVPLGVDKGQLLNALFVIALIGGLLLLYVLFERLYGPILRWCLDHKALFLTAPITIVLFGLSVWLGFDRAFSFIPYTYARLGGNPADIRSSDTWVAARHALPGLGKEFMPPLDEGSFLFMPSAMPHASIGEALDILQKQDRAITAIPEVESVVGKIGRAETALDPAPLQMIETIVTLTPEYILDEDGNRRLFRYDTSSASFTRDEHNALIPDQHGKPFRLWREHIRSTDDIWDEIVRAGNVPGATSAPKLQPIAARLVMLQTGIRAPMAVKIKGPTLESIEQVALDVERLLKEVPAIQPAAVIADRVIGKPYIEIDVDRERIARYGLSVQDVQMAIDAAIGGAPITTTVEGRERYPVRVRYMRELRDQPETLAGVLIAAMPEDGGAASMPDSAEQPVANRRAHIPLADLATIRSVRGPDMIKSEDTFLVGYVLFDKKPGVGEVDAVEQARRFLDSNIASGALTIPNGVSISYAGTWENQARAQKTLIVLVPLALSLILLVLYLQFRGVLMSLIVFSSVVVAWGGGFTMLWLYAQPWWFDFEILGRNMRDLFQFHPINLSVAVWVGFLALFGIAEDDGVVIATYVRQSLNERKPRTIPEIRAAIFAAGLRRVRPCLMTTATTVLALLPVLTSTGRGSDLMIPMAIPTLGGMTVVLITMFVVPTLCSLLEETKLRFSKEAAPST
ncbi:MAG: efflux RND transporter permease subunit [Phycisphaerales bacterium]